VTAQCDNHSYAIQAGGAGLTDPFAELRAFCEKVREKTAAAKGALAAKRRSAWIAAWVWGLLAAIMLVVMIARRSGLMLLPVIGFGGVAVWKRIRVSRLDAKLRMYEPAKPRLEEARAGDSVPAISENAGGPETRTREEGAPVAANRAELPPEPPAAPARSEAEPVTESRGRPVLARFILAGGLALAVIVLGATGSALATASLFSLGLFVAAISPSPPVAGVLGTALLYPLLYFAGLWVPRQNMSAGLRHVGDFTPLGSAVQSLLNSLQGSFPPTHALVVMAVWAIVMTLAAVRFFRWE